MERDLAEFLGELEAYGLSNDQSAESRGDKILNITRDTGVFLNLLVRAVRACRILEIGTSNGYSTLWLAEAARDLGGHVVTVEHRSERAEMAAANFERAGLSSRIEQYVRDAGEFMGSLPDAAVDFLFLDAERSEYPAFWPDLQRVLAPNGLLVVDNATSHAAEMAPFRAIVEASPGFLTSLVPVGKGEFLVLKLPGTAGD